MIKAVRITTPYGNDERDIVVKLNEFFEEHNLDKDDVVYINMSEGFNPEYVSFYILYDEQDDEY